MTPMHRRSILLLLAGLTLSVPSAAADGDVQPPASPTKPAPDPWCAPELETLPGDVCYAPVAPEKGAERTLVIFLHGLVKRGAGWQHNQMRGMARSGKRLGFSLLAPRGQPGGSQRHGADMVAWPTGRNAQLTQESALISRWDEARALIEKRQGSPFDEVFVVGFSNGAYYGSSLALRGRLQVDGYALFAGGSPRQPMVTGTQRAPIFVGVSGKDDTAKLALELGRLLKRHRWPHRQETRPVGHLIADRHLDHALAYLREQRSKAKTGKTDRSPPSRPAAQP
jgi:predicted esterase